MIAALMALALAGEDRLNPRHVRLEARVCQGDPLGSRADGTVKYVAEPSVLVPSRRSAFFQTGCDGNGAALIRPDDKGWLGVTVLVTPVCYPNGTIWAEITATDSRLNRGLDVVGRPGVMEQKWRHARFFAPGETYRFRVAADSPTSQTWVEVTLREEAPRK